MLISSSSLKDPKIKKSSPGSILAKMHSVPMLNYELLT